MRPALALIALLAVPPAHADGMRRGFDVPDRVEVEERVIATPWTLDIPADRREASRFQDRVIVAPRRPAPENISPPGGCVRTANGEVWCRR
jgi:hypothetical protein